MSDARDKALATNRARVIEAAQWFLADNGVPPSEQCGGVAGFVLVPICVHGSPIACFSTFDMPEDAAQARAGQLLRRVAHELLTGEKVRE